MTTAGECAPALPPTTSELKKLVEDAAAGSKAAQEKLDRLALENVELTERIDRLEAAQASKEKAAAAAAPKKEEKADEAAASNADDFCLLGWD
jgi:septal ring factor EnvC (AmiA/AmiB activator)